MEVCMREVKPWNKKKCTAEELDEYMLEGCL